MRAEPDRVGGALVPLAAGGLTAALLAYAVADPGPARAVWPLGVLLLAAGVAALGWQRKRPGLVLVLTAAVAAAYYLSGFPPGPETVPFVVALVTAAAAGRRVLAAVAEAGTGDEAVELAAAHRPDVVLMDIRMPGIDGLTATARIAADPALDAVRVVVLTTYDLDEYVYAALRAGASGFLLKDAGHAEIIAGVRAIAGGGALLAPSVTRRLIAEFAARPRRAVDGSGLRQLTPREHEVLLLVAAGLSNDEIGERLRMSPATAKTHVTRIQAKLRARDRAQLVVVAYEAGLVRPGWLV